MFLFKKNNKIQWSLWRNEWGDLEITETKSKPTTKKEQEETETTCINRRLDDE